MIQAKEFEGELWIKATHYHIQKQEQGEPVAWYYKIDATKGISFCRDNDLSKPWEPLYTTPQQRKPLTDKQIDEIPFALFVPDQDGMSTTEGLREFARAIESAHGIKDKNT